MYCTPCARLTKSITPNTSVRPAAIRNNRTPSCSPLSTCTRTRVVFMRQTRQVRSPHGAKRNAGTADPGFRFASSGLQARRGTASFHRAILGVRVGVVGKNLLVDLGLEFS